jgi:hypothetical protein
MKKLILLAAALAAAVVLTACGGGGGNVPIIATQDATATISASNGQQATTPILNKDFTFAAGVPALKTSGPTTITLRPRTATTLPDNRVPAGNPEFNLTSPQGRASGVVQFGSCIFIVDSSTIPGLPVGSSVTVTNCSVTYDVSGQEVNTTVTVGVVITLDGVTSQPVSITVTISSSGAVSVNGSPTGATAPTGQATGGTGGSST